MAARLAAICAFLAFVTLILGWILEALAQPDAYSSAEHDEPAAAASIP